tara:strand:- start:323 stop:844 length:522 start_codon:yes stop_codon:yes gene_type:complete
VYIFIVNYLIFALSCRRIFAVEKCRIFAYYIFNVHRGCQMTIQDRIKTRVKRSKRSVFLRSDFKDIADYDQVGRGLRSLAREGLLMKIGYGLYARARVNRITGKLMPDNAAGADGVLIEAMERLDVDYKFDDLSNMNFSGQSTQIPASVKIVPTDPRFTRKITVGKQRVNEAR